MDDQNNILYSSEVLEFVKLSNDFCTLLETEIDLSQEDFIRFMLFNLSGIYSAMIRIGELEPFFDEANEKFVTEHDWAEVFRKVSSCMKGNNEFLDIPDEKEFDRSELVTRKISEDIADIYQDLRDFLELYRNSPEDIMNDALWECQNNFTAFWGRRILRVTSALHRIYSGDVPSTQNRDRKPDESRNIDTSNWFISKRQQEYREDENDFFTEHQ